MPEQKHHSENCSFSTHFIVKQITKAPKNNGEKIV